MAPRLGDIVRARDIAELGGKYGYHKCVWAACEACAAERWVLLKGGQPQSRWCYPCGRKIAGGMVQTRHYGPDHHSYRGGRHVMKNGYVSVLIAPDDPFAGMADRRLRVYEHRLVMARKLGRQLSPDEEVHHLDGDKHNNDEANLEVLLKGEHTRRHWQQGHRVAELEAMVRRLGGEP